MKRKTLAKLTLLAAVAVPFSVRTPLLGQDRVQVEIANEVSSPGRILGFPLPFDEIPARFAGLSIQTVPDSDAKTALAFDEKALRKVLDVKVGRPHGAGIFNFAVKTS